MQGAWEGALLSCGIYQGCLVLSALATLSVVLTLVIHCLSPSSVVVVTKVADFMLSVR